MAALNDVWRFDGAQSTSGTPVYTYASAGLYTVVLVAYTSGGSYSTMTRRAYVNITAPVTHITQVAFAAASGWIDTGFPKTPEALEVYDIGTTATSLYVPMTLNNISVLAKTQFSTGGGGTTGSVITHAQSGDIYNIGGVSSEPTNAIVITAWGVKKYGNDVQLGEKDL